MKQTDGWTDARQFHRPCCAYYVDRTAKLFGVLLVDAFFCALFYVGFCIVLYLKKILQLQQQLPFYGHYTGQLALRTGGFCWCRVLLSACPCFLDHFSDCLFVVELVILIQPARKLLDILSCQLRMRTSFTSPYQNAAALMMRPGTD